MGNVKGTLEMSFTDFRNFCNDNEFDAFVFSSVNQDSYLSEYCVGYSVALHNIKFACNPNRILLFNDDEERAAYLENYLTFSLVNKVIVTNVGDADFLYQTTFVCGKEGTKSSREYNINFYKKIS